jgi:hypothetical protein
MIALTWTMVAVLTVLWTAGAWIAAAATEWAAQALAAGTVGQAARDLAAVPLPEWLKFWIDPAWLQTIAQWIADAAGEGLPLAGTAAGWLVPAIWITWSVGVLLLLLAAAGVHLLVRRLAGDRSAPAPLNAALRP